MIFFPHGACSRLVGFFCFPRYLLWLSVVLHSVGGWAGGGGPRSLLTCLGPWSRLASDFSSMWPHSPCDASSLKVSLSLSGLSPQQDSLDMLCIAARWPESKEATLQSSSGQGLEVHRDISTTFLLVKTSHQAVQIQDKGKPPPLMRGGTRLCLGRRGVVGDHPRYESVCLSMRWCLEFTFVFRFSIVNEVLCWNCEIIWSYFSQVI